MEKMKPQTHPQTSHIFTKRIGATLYKVSVHFSTTSKENMNDKILRLIRNDTTFRKAVGQ